MKACTKCGEVKSLLGFHRHRYSKDGLKSRCKSCNASDALTWKHSNPDKVRAYRRTRRKKYPQKWAPCIKKWRLKNPQKIASYNKKWKANNPAAIRAEGVRKRERLSDSYIRGLIKGTTRIPRSLIPQALIETYRIKIQLERYLWQNQTT